MYWWSADHILVWVHNEETYWNCIFMLRQYVGERLWFEVMLRYGSSKPVKILIFGCKSLRWFVPKRKNDSLGELTALFFLFLLVHLVWSKVRDCKWGVLRKKVWVWNLLTKLLKLVAGLTKSGAKSTKLAVYRCISWVNWLKSCTVCGNGLINTFLFRFSRV